MGFVPQRCLPKILFSGHISRDGTGIFYEQVKKVEFGGGEGGGQYTHCKSFFCREKRSIKKVLNEFFIQGLFLHGLLPNYLSRKFRDFFVVPLTKPAF